MDAIGYINLSFSGGNFSYHWSSHCSSNIKRKRKKDYCTSCFCRNNFNFWNYWAGTFWTASIQKVLKLNDFQNGSPGQTTMLTASRAKFCIEPRSPFPNISHHELKTLGKPPIIVSWPERQPEFASDGNNGYGDSFSRTPSIPLSSERITPRNPTSHAGNPSLRS